MPAKRGASNRYSNQRFMGAGANRTVDHAVDGMINIGTMYTAGMVGIGLLDAVKGSFK